MPDEYQTCGFSSANAEYAGAKVAASQAPGDAASFGRRLKAAIVLADTTAGELAVEIGPDLQISRGTLERMMQGKRAPRPWEVERLAQALGVPAWFLRDGLQHAEAEAVTPDADAPARRHDEVLGRLDQLGEMMRTLMARLEDVRSHRE
jgi:hypothetical protein